MTWFDKLFQTIEASCKVRMLVRCRHETRSPIDGSCYRCDCKAPIIDGLEPIARDIFAEVAEEVLEEVEEELKPVGFLSGMDPKAVALGTFLILSAPAAGDALAIYEHHRSPHLVQTDLFDSISDRSNSYDIELGIMTATGSGSTNQVVVVQAKWNHYSVVFPLH